MKNFKKKNPIMEQLEKKLLEKNFFHDSDNKKFLASFFQENKRELTSEDRNQILQFLIKISEKITFASGR